jgi:hypothetical protein
MDGVPQLLILLMAREGNPWSDRSSAPDQAQGYRLNIRAVDGEVCPVVAAAGRGCAKTGENGAILPRR